MVVYIADFILIILCFVVWNLIPVGSGVSGSKIRREEKGKRKSALRETPFVSDPRLDTMNRAHDSLSNLKIKIISSRSAELCLMWHAQVYP